MADAFDQNAQDVGLSLDSIEDELRCGLALHSDRLVEAFVNEEFYAGRNQLWLSPRESEDWDAFCKRPKRTSKLTRTVIRKLAEDLYSPGPTRRLEGDAAADKWLQDIYRQNHINALMKQADRKSTLNGAAAIQVYCTGRPERPVKLYLYGAHEFAVWGWPDDNCEPWAVCTIARERKFTGGFLLERLRFEVWSRDEHRVYRGNWLQAPEYGPSYARCCYAYLFGQSMTYVNELSGDPKGSGINPYGCLPFSFVHAEPPISDFWEGGIGCMLRDCNAEIDRELSDLAQHSADAMDGDRFLFNVSPGFRREKATGRWQHVNAAKGGEEGLQPRAEITQPKLNTELIWLNINSYANMTLEELDVPLISVHSDASTDLSGIAIVAKHLPLLARTRSRQPDFAIAETELAATVLTAAGNFYGAGVTGASSPLAIALADAGEDSPLALIWPEPRMPLPTPERDVADKNALDEGMTSLVEVVAQRDGSTPEQAKEHIERIIADNAWLASKLPKPPAQDTAGEDEGEAGEGWDLDEDEGEDEGEEQ